MPNLGNYCTCLFRPPPLLRARQIRLMALHMLVQSQPNFWMRWQLSYVVRFDSLFGHLLVTRRRRHPQYQMDPGQGVHMSNVRFLQGRKQCFYGHGRTFRRAITATCSGCPSGLNRLVIPSMLSALNTLSGPNTDKICNISTREETMSIRVSRL